MNSASATEHRTYRVAALPGDGVGPEVYGSAVEVLAVIRDQFGVDVQLEEQLIGER
jgi:3-isopropylmalate dehydrogenase